MSEGKPVVEKPWWKEALGKTTLANTAAFIIVTSGLAVTAYFQKWELFGMVLGAGVGYLFPKQTKTE